jgi:hypothetical protein
MTSDTYLVQRKRLRDLGTRVIQAADMGDIASAKTHVENANEIITAIISAWQKHRIGSMYPLGEEPSDEESGGGEFGGGWAAGDSPTEDESTEQSSPAPRVQVIRVGNNLLGDNADLEI